MSGKRKKAPPPQPAPEPEQPATAERPHIAIWPDTPDLIKAAEAGDDRARARLYGQAGALLAADGALPEPLQSFARDGLRRAVKGAQFSRGKPKGARGPLAKAIAAYLRKHPKATAEAVWMALKDRPPAGFTFCDNRLGRYIEHGAATAMQWERFRNAVSENRPASAKRVTKKAPAITE